MGGARIGALKGDDGMNSGLQSEKIPYCEKGHSCIWEK